MFVVILAQSAATSRAYAARYEERFEREHGHGRPRRGEHRRRRSPARSSSTAARRRPQIADSAGGRTQLAPHDRGRRADRPAVPDQAAPVPAERVLASVVFLIGVELVDIAGHAARSCAGPRASSGSPSSPPSTSWSLGRRAGDRSSRSSSRSSRTCAAATARQRRARRARATTGRPSRSSRCPRQSPASSSTAGAQACTSPTRRASRRRSPRWPRRAAARKWVCVDAVAMGDVDYSGGETLVQVSNELRSAASGSSRRRLGPCRAASSTRRRDSGARRGRPTIRAWPRRSRAIERRSQAGRRAGAVRAACVRPGYDTACLSSSRPCG